jgi:zinc protease
MSARTRTQSILPVCPADLAPLNARLLGTTEVKWRSSIPFGDTLRLDRFELANGLTVLTCEDHSSPVVSYHTWFRVGSRHEKEPKTGIAHLLEHLMFNETEKLPQGAYDQMLEEAGAETNASTWLDFTQYSVNAPKQALKLVVTLEAERMLNLVLREPQVASEKEVVANERRYRVEDDVEGAMNELLWASAFREHQYRCPTIGWMPDIEGLTHLDCEQFYRTYYAPNNATLVVVGDFKTPQLIELIASTYGPMKASVLPLEDVQPEPPQDAERRKELNKPTPTEKLCVGYRAPALGDWEYVPLSVLAEVLTGGRASRLVHRLVHELEIATDVRASVGPFFDPGLLEITASAREGHTCEALLKEIDADLARLHAEPVTDEELERALARSELGLVSGLDTMEGKASTIGFYETVLGEPAAAFARLNAMRRVGQSDIRRVARRYLNQRDRTCVFVRRETAGASGSQS